MAKVSTRITPLRQMNDLIIAQSMGQAAGAATVAQYARQRLVEAQETNRQAIGRVPPHETFVNGTRSDNLEAVQPGKSIIFRFELVTDLFGWILDQLQKHSPVLTGDYRKSHTLYADGVECDPANPPPAAEYVILSTSPYARKVEGDAKRKPQSRQAPDGVYQGVSVLANRRFGNVASVYFGYRSPLLSYIAGGANRAERAALRGQRAKISAMGFERSTRVPAIIIRL